MILHLGDCLEYMKTMPKVDAVITSPPYNFGGFSRNGRKREYSVYDDSKKEDKYRSFIADALKGCSNLLLEGGVIYWNHKGKFKNWVYEHPYWVIDKCPTNLFQTIVWNYPSSPDVAVGNVIATVPPAASRNITFPLSASVNVISAFTSKVFFL